MLNRCKIFFEVEGAKCGPDLCADHCNGTFDDGQADWVNLEYAEVPCSSNLPNLDFTIGNTTLVTLFTVTCFLTDHHVYVQSY